MGAAETERVAASLDQDGWNAEDFTEKDDGVLQRLLKAVNSDPPEWSTSTTPIWDPAPAILPSNGTSETNGTTKPQSRPAQIDDEKFTLVASVISLLPTIESFLALTVTLPSMTPQIVGALLEVLRTFNSRSCQLILGAGAMRSVGLKNITTKHLALSSQALSFVIALVPYLREAVRRRVPAGQAAVLADFDKTKRLYQDHQAGIHDKVVDIITGRSLAHVKAMRATDFGDGVVGGTNGAEVKPSPYMETLTKETLTLQRVLGRHLSEVNVGIIMKQIFTNYREQWVKAFGEVDIKSTAAGEALLRDAECLNARLGKMDGFEEVGKEIVALVKSRVAAIAKPEKAAAEKTEAS